MFEEVSFQKDYGVMLGTFIGSILFFLLVFESSRALLECLVSRTGFRKPWMETYASWPPHKKADLSFRICGQVFAILSLVFATKAIFFTW